MNGQEFYDAIVKRLQAEGKTRITGEVIINYIASLSEDTLLNLIGIDEIVDAKIEERDRQREYDESVFGKPDE